MSKNSNKELIGIYKRCLWALNQNFKMNLPSYERVKRFEEKVSDAVFSDASKKHFSSKSEMEAWIEKRFDQLYNEELGRLFKDPNGKLKDQIRKIIGQAE